MADGYRSASDLCLNADEVRLLVAGLSHWAGAARCSDEFSAAMGFRDTSSLPRACWKISDIIEENEPLAAMDWARAILATEASFASDLIGCGEDWGTVTGLRDETIGQSGNVRIVRPETGGAKVHYYFDAAGGYGGSW